MNLFELAKQKIKQTNNSKGAEGSVSEAQIAINSKLALVDESEGLSPLGLDQTKEQKFTEKNNLVKGTVINESYHKEVHESEVNEKELAHSLNFTTLAPCPLEVSETGLSEYLLLGLVLKHLQYFGVLTLRQLSQNLSLSGGIVQALIDICKSKSWIENYSNNTEDQMRYSLSSIGTVEAERELLKSGYIGPAPVPLKQYTKICLKQSSREHNITIDELNSAFSALTFSEELINKVGPSLNSTKPILIYGEAGTGKSYFCRHLNLVFGEEVLIPHAIEVNNEIIQVFDPEIHQLSNTGRQDNILKLASSYDPRWLLCKRPLVVSGGELSADMLEVRFDPRTRTYRAPLQLKANNGILLLDDLGRQKVTPKELFNRWIIPLEERRDFLTLQSGLHFELPFELILLFSTNLTPSDLVDDAFLRRLGYKIQFEPMTKELYQTIWFEECINSELQCELSVFNYLTTHLHALHNRNFLPCYPRDLLSIAKDQVKFKNLPTEITKELLDFAWQSYFVK